MIFRSLLALTLIVTLFVHTLIAIDPAYLPDNSNNEFDDQQSVIITTRNTHEDIDDDADDYVLIKRNKYPNFHLSPLWLSRRTRTNRFYGKPLWISRQGR